MISQYVHIYHVGALTDPTPCRCCGSQCLATGRLDEGLICNYTGQQGPIGARQRCTLTTAGLAPCHAKAAIIQAQQMDLHASCHQYQDYCHFALHKHDGNDRKQVPEGTQPPFVCTHKNESIQLGSCHNKQGRYSTARKCLWCVVASSPKPPSRDTKPADICRVRIIVILHINDDICNQYTIYHRLPTEHNHHHVKYTSGYTPYTYTCLLHIPLSVPHYLEMFSRPPKV